MRFLVVMAPGYLQVKVDGSGRVSQTGSERRSVHLCACKTPAEAAAAFDLAHIWRQLQVCCFGTALACLCTLLASTALGIYGLVVRGG